MRRPEPFRPVQPPPWLAGGTVEAYQRKTKAQTPRGRLVEAQTGARGLFTVSAPVGPRKGRTVLDFVAATDSPMVAFLGTIQLRINRDSVDLGRLESGVMALAVDHDVTRLMGRVTEGTIHSGRLDMKAEVGNTPAAEIALTEIDDLMRAGFSPGFIVHASETLSEGDRGYDESEMFQIEVTRWEPYEISSTAIPRNRDAKLRGVASMSTTMLETPALVSTSDLIGLSLAAGREVLRSGSGSESQREKLAEFFNAYETGLENGLSRDVAAQAAKLVVGL